MRVVLKLLLLPIVVGISYEFNRLVGRHDNWLTRALSAPGMWLQYLTTNEPDDSMLEVGIEALTLVLPEKEGETLEAFLAEHVFADAVRMTLQPDPADVEGFRTFLNQYKACLRVEQAATENL